MITKLTSSHLTTCFICLRMKRSVSGTYFSKCVRNSANWSGVVFSLRLASHDSMTDFHW